MQNMTVAFLLLGPPDSLHDWTKEHDFGLSNQNDASQVYSRKHWRLVRCQNGILPNFLFTFLHN